MTGRIPENILEDILNRVNIAEVISGYIPLKRAGRNFKALCPFHHEKTPSFMVSPERQIYHCFGCQESGNVFKFLMRYERMDFPEAVEAMAKKTGVVLPEFQTRDPRSVSISTELYKINETTGAFYAQELNSEQGLEAKNYLLKRGIKNETIRLFGLGFALSRWDSLINHLRSKHFSLSLLEKAGLILAKDGGGYYDRFRNRIMFPIVDIKARTLAFGARVLDNSLPKYINSPETPVYVKGKNLYGLNLAKESIRENDFAVVVEGYFDFIFPYQEGLTNVVASLGTALTPEQARLLKRYTNNVVMVYDADAAGELAALRSLDIFIEEGMEVRVVSLPHGYDPDLFIRQKGIAALKEMIKNAGSLFDYKLGILKLRYNPKEIEGKAKIASLMLETINKFKNAVLKSEYIKKLAQELDVKEQALLYEVKAITQLKSYSDTKPVIPRKASGINPTEKLLIKLMMEERELVEKIKEQLEPADFNDERTSRIVSIMFDLIAQGKNIGPSLLMQHLSDDDFSQVVCESMFMPEANSQSKEKIVDDCISRMKSEKLKLKRHHLHEQIKTAQNTGDEERLHLLMKEFCNLTRKGEGK